MIYIRVITNNEMIELILGCFEISDYVINPKKKPFSLASVRSLKQGQKAGIFFAKKKNPKSQKAIY